MSDVPDLQAAGELQIAPLPPREPVTRRALHRDRVTPVQQHYVVVITGPVGAGKTTSLRALADLLARRGESVATVDLDSLRALWPGDPDDPFHARLGMTNLAAIWPHFAHRGARWLLLGDVVEHPDQRADYERAVPGGKIVLVRLEVSMDRLHERLRRRETGESLEWYLDRSAQQQQLMTERDVGDVVVPVDDHDPGAVAELILHSLPRLTEPSSA